MTEDGYEYSSTGGSETRIAPTRAPTSTMLSPNVDAMIAQVPFIRNTFCYHVLIFLSFKARETENTLSEQIKILRNEKQQKDNER